jgi:hypothetical protein
MDIVQSMYIMELKIPYSGNPFPVTPTLSMRREQIETQRVRYSQCAKLTQNGKHTFYHVALADPNSNEQLLQSLPLLVNPSVEELTPGIYTYVVMSTNENEYPNLYMLKTMTTYEYGTKHQQLIYRVACTDNRCNPHIHIYLAGEIQYAMNKSESESEVPLLEYNFYSGTYMLHADRTSRLSDNEPKMIQLMHEFLNQLGFRNNAYVNTTYIKAESLPITKSDLEMYKRFGAVIREFDTFEDCTAYKLHLKNYPQTPIPKHLLEPSRLFGRKSKSKSKSKRNSKSKSKSKRKVTHRHSL